MKKISFFQIVSLGLLSTFTSISAYSEISFSDQPVSTVGQSYGYANSDYNPMESIENVDDLQYIFPQSQSQSVTETEETICLDDDDNAIACPLDESSDDVSNDYASSDYASSDSNYDVCIDDSGNEVVCEAQSSENPESTEKYPCFDESNNEVVCDDSMEYVCYDELDNEVVCD